MCFADARGIPVVDRNGNSRRWDDVKNSLTISDLHDLIAENIPIAPGSREKKLLRTLIQLENGIAGQPDYPKYGIDANRDVNLNLVSSIAFNSFMRNIYQQTNTSSRNETGVRIYDMDTKGYTDEITRSTARNIQVFMMHGYEDNGAVYGPYSVKKKDIRQNWPAAMSVADKRRVNNIMRVLFGHFFNISTIADPLNNENVNDPHLYMDTEYDARGYQGEWGIRLYEMGIWSVDIELPGRYASEPYDEGVRGITSIDRIYISSRIGDTKKPLFYTENNPFLNVIKNIGWP
jgi:hypothetical protein